MDSQTSSVKDQVVNIFRFVGHLASAAATQHCHCSVKAATDDASPNGWDSVPIKLYLQGWICSMAAVSRPLMELVNGQVLS